MALPRTNDYPQAVRSSTAIPPGLVSRTPHRDGRRMDLDLALTENYGVVRTELLLRSGFSTADIRRQVARGALTPLRRGWYAAAEHHRDVVSAVRAGGVLSCVSALALRNIWTPPTPQIHARFTDHASYRRGVSTASGTVRQCGAKLGNRRPTAAVDSLLLALCAAADCVSEEYLVAIVDSLVRTGPVELDDVRRCLSEYPQRVRRMLDYVDPAAESGTESLVRVRLARRRIRVRTQVRIAGVGRVDLLVGDRLIIEVDSRAHHTGEERYEADRRRDRNAAVKGYLVVRVTYHQVMHDWAAVEADILTMIRSRRHVGCVSNPADRR